jgi:hypothetical protein
VAVAVCLDCNIERVSREGPPVELPEGFICEHFQPEYWESKGFKRNWGDAAVMNWPSLEILRKETATEWIYIILSPFSSRRPVMIYSSKDGKSSWGGY